MKERWKERKDGGIETKKERSKKGRKERRTDDRREGRKRRQEGKWAGLDALAGRFWPTGRMFDTPGLNTPTPPTLGSCLNTPTPPTFGCCSVFDV